MSVIQISAKELQQKLKQDPQPLLLDVRELNEYEFASITGCLHIPMNQIPQRLNEINSSAGCVVVCHHGIRSQHVADFLIDAGFTGLFNLNGGIDAWSVECDNSVSRY